MTSFKSRWVSLVLLCLGDLMIVLDTTVVNVALPSIRLDLGFNETSLVWVVNAYLLTFAGFLLLGGRLGDLYGHRRLFLGGLAVFTVASLVCGIAHTQWLLLAARAVQGLGGAVVSAVALSLLLTLFPEEHDRTRAMGFFGFIVAGGGAIGVFLGGLLTGSFDWHWVFLINIPIGVAVFVLCLFLLPHSKNESALPHLDILGAVTITLSLMLAMYALIGGNQAGWLSAQTLGLAAAAAAVFAAFLYIESRAKAPLVPLNVFAIPNVGVVSVIGILWSAAMFAWFFLSALYLQLVLHYPPFQIGLAFLPANLIMAIFSVWLSAKVIGRFGIKIPLVAGMLLIALGLMLFALAPLSGELWVHVIPAMVLLGIGCGMAFNPVLLAGTASVPAEESGLASGVLNTAFMMGGSIGLAALASLAAWRSAALAAEGAGTLPALLGGYHAAFWAGALCALCAALLGATKVAVSKHPQPLSGH